MRSFRRLHAAGRRLQRDRRRHRHAGDDGIGSLTAGAGNENCVDPPGTSDDDQFNHAVQTIATDPLHPDVVVIGMGLHMQPLHGECPRFHSGGKVFRSADAGATWTDWFASSHPTASLGTATINDIVISPVETSAGVRPVWFTAFCLATSATGECLHSTTGLFRGNADQAGPQQFKLVGDGDLPDGDRSLRGLGLSSSGRLFVSVVDYERRECRRSPGDGCAADAEPEECNCAAPDTTYGTYAGGLWASDDDGDNFTYFFRDSGFQPADAAPILGSVPAAGYGTRNGPRGSSQFPTFAVLGETVVVGGQPESGPDAQGSQKGVWVWTPANGWENEATGIFAPYDRAVGGPRACVEGGTAMALLSPPASEDFVDAPFAFPFEFGTLNRANGSVDPNRFLYGFTGGAFLAERDDACTSGWRLSHLTNDVARLAVTPLGLLAKQWTSTGLDDGGAWDIAVTASGEFLGLADMGGLVVADTSTTPYRWERRPIPEGLLPTPTRGRPHSRPVMGFPSLLPVRPDDVMAITVRTGQDLTLLLYNTSADPQIAIVRTADEGRTWTALGSTDEGFTAPPIARFQPDPGHRAVGMVKDPSSPGGLIVATEGSGLWGYRVGSEGPSWRPICPELPNIRAISWDPALRQEVLVLRDPGGAAGGNLWVVDLATDTCRVLGLNGADPANPSALAVRVTNNRARIIAAGLKGTQGQRVPYWFALEVPVQGRRLSFSTEQTAVEVRPWNCDTFDADACRPEHPSVYRDGASVSDIAFDPVPADCLLPCKGPPCPNMRVACDTFVLGFRGGPNDDGLVCPDEDPECPQADITGAQELAVYRWPTGGQPRWDSNVDLRGDLPQADILGLEYNARPGNPADRKLYACTLGTSVWTTSPP